MNFSKSEALWEDAIRLIPTGTQTLSKMPSQFAVGLSPKFIERGEGAYIWDLDGNKFVDFGGALGPIILGYNHPVVKNAIAEQLEKGCIFSLGNSLEIELAELLVDTIPSAEMVKFGKNGNDVTSAAIRLARAHTGREKIAICGYHGWQDWYIITTPFDRGIPGGLKQYSLTFTYNNIETLEKVFKENPDEIAAVILEPVGVEIPQDDFLDKVKIVTHQNGALLIFDEVKSGFRCHLGGAQTLYNVVPDLSCFGKAMANGMPMSALVGQKNIMNTCEDIFFSMQAGGELLSIAASIATINELKKTKALEIVKASGEQLIKGCKTILKNCELQEFISIKGLPHYTIFDFMDGPNCEKLELKTLFVQESMERGIFCGGYSILSAAHTSKIISQTLEEYKKIFAIISKAVLSGNLASYLKCPVVCDVFRKP